MARQESFDLLRQGAQDIRAYDCIKDISRVESFVYDRPGADGAVVVLTMTPTTGLHAHTVGSLTPSSFASMRAQRFRV